MENSTSIFDLPTNPIDNTNINNINISSIETNIEDNDKNALTLDQTTINQIVSGLQQASMTGATKLPSRDIPMATHNLTQDIQTTPNYIPTTQSTIQSNMDYNETDDIINTYNNRLQNNSKLDDFYNTIQIPILLAILYFLFQLPIFKKTLYKYLSFLFLSDGNYNINGYLFTSCLYGFFYYLINLFILHNNG
jgi:hypothetical protein